jgi:hypothetical protein
MRPQPIAFRRGPPEPQIEFCGQTTLFPADLPILFGGQAARLPRLCRAEISTSGEPSASVYFAPGLPGAAPTLECPPVFIACALLFRYLTRRQESAFEDMPHDVDCCFKDTCGFPIVHVSLVGQGVDGYEFRGVVHPRLDVSENFTVRYSADELMLLGL